MSLHPTPLSPLVADGEVRLGAVCRFDDKQGYGEVEAHDGRRLFFHCTAIADGSRTVAVGTRVAFVVVAGHGGAWEATSLVPLPDPARAAQEGAGPPDGPGSAASGG